MFTISRDCQGKRRGAGEGVSWAHPSVRSKSRCVVRGESTSIICHRDETTDKTKVLAGRSVRTAVLGGAIVVFIVACTTCTCGRQLSLLLMDINS